MNSEGGGVEAGARAGARTSSKSRLRESGVVESGLLGASSLCAMTPSGVKSLSSLLGAVKPRGRFLQQADILEQSK